MAIGKRIKHFRNLIGLTQKELGEKLGFSGRTTDVRVAQYESESRVPKEDLTKELASIFGISPKAISVPNIDTYDGIMHTLFALEDMYGFQVDKLSNEICIRIRPIGNHEYPEISRRIDSWYNAASKYRDDKISKEEYDDWRYNYPDKDDSIHSAKLLPENLFDES